jgi:hypothetical protein
VLALVIPAVGCHDSKDIAVFFENSYFEVEF